MAKFKFKACLLFNKIDKVEIESETDKQVQFYKYFSGMKSKSIFRESKICNYHAYFDTFEQAKTFLLEKLMKEIDELQQKISSRKDLIGKVENLKEVI